MQKFKRAYHTTVAVIKIYLALDAKLVFALSFLQILQAINAIATSYLFALFIGEIVSALTSGEVVATKILPVILFLVVYQGMVQLVDILQGYFDNKMRMKDIPHLKIISANHLISLGIAQLEDPDLTNRSTRFNEISVRMYDYLQLFLSLLAMVVGIILNLIIFMRILPLFVIILIGVFVFKFFTNRKYMQEIWLLNRDSTEESRRAYNSIWFLTDPASLKEILIGGGITLLTRKFLSFTKSLENAHMKIRTRWLFFEFSYIVIDTILYGYGLFALISKSIASSLGVSAVTFYGRTLFTLVSQLNGFSYRFSRVVEQSIRIEDAIELFEMFSPGQDGTKVLPKSATPPSIEFKNVSFSYPKSPNIVLKNLNFKINPGEKIAIVGENGAGKTTLVKLLTRFYIPKEGIIEIDSAPLSELKIKSWYSKLGTLFQDYNSYGALTVAENVAIGRLRKGVINRERVWNSLKKADADGFVSVYPQKLDQTLSERYKGGIRPSGGQWQKIAIARLFYRNAPVLILDEPTAAIDAVAEAHIFNNIYKFMKGKTVIIISHRFSTVRNADRILVLDKGRVIEMGSHDELLKLDGKYAHAFNLQAKGYS